MLLRGEKQNICLADHDLIWAKLRVHTYTQARLYVTQREINVWEGIPPKIISGFSPVDFHVTSQILFSYFIGYIFSEYENQKQMIKQLLFRGKNIQIPITRK